MLLFDSCLWKVNKCAIKLRKIVDRHKLVRSTPTTTFLLSSRQCPEMLQTPSPLSYWSWLCVTQCDLITLVWHIIPLNTSLAAFCYHVETCIRRKRAFPSEFFFSMLLFCLPQLSIEGEKKSKNFSLLKKVAFCCENFKAFHFLTLNSI